MTYSNDYLDIVRTRPLHFIVNGYIIQCSLARLANIQHFANLLRQFLNFVKYLFITTFIMFCTNLMWLKIVDELTDCDESTKFIFWFISNRTDCHRIALFSIYTVTKWLWRIDGICHRYGLSPNWMDTNENYNIQILKMYTT